MCFLCPDTPPEQVLSKGSRGVRDTALLQKQSDPHQFALGLKDACCAEPCCCILSAFGSPWGCTACWARKAVLDKYYNGMQDFVCFQGYVPGCCCFDAAGCFPGSELGLCLEGCCCPVFSLSIARLHLMDSKRIRPDPCDYQIIACSNALQCLACILDIVGAFVEQARDLAHLIDLIADLFTLSVMGCMGAQIHHEIKKDADGVVFVVVEGIPVGTSHVVVTAVAPPGSLAAHDSMIPVAGGAAVGGGMQTMQITLPPTAVPGQQMQVDTPGGPMTFVVPADAVPGAPLTIQVPAPAVAIAQPIGAPPKGEEMER